MLKGGAEKIKLLSVLKHLQAHREGTGDASESSLPRGKATPLYLERRWLCSRRQGSTACKGRASRVTIALWWRGRAAVSCYLLACYRHVPCDIPVAAGRNLGEDLRPCRETADWKTEEGPPYLDRAGSKMSQTTQCGCRQPLPTDWSSLPHPSLECFSALAAQAGLGAACSWPLWQPQVPKATPQLRPCLVLCPIVVSLLEVFAQGFQ